VTKTIIIDRSPDEVYVYWQDLENLPNFMSHLKSVRITGEKQSHWTAKGPAGTTVEWDAETIDDQPGSRIAWRSLPDSAIENSGSVQFERATGNRGTFVRVEITYMPPAGAAGAMAAKLFGEEPEQQLDDDLRALKQVIETGEVVKSDASIHSGMHAAQPPEAGERPLTSEVRDRTGDWAFAPVNS
jgi:uncharacterized membrane protein